EKTAQDVFDSVEKELALEEADTFGGDTPEETWEMFLNALQEGDLELASKYFVIDKQAENLAWFQQVENAGMLGEMIGDLMVSGLNLVSDRDNMKDYAIGRENEMRKAYIKLRKNINNKWKLESI
ncbi:MAG: hypothetical protein U9P90_01405, partial [Patescibacteria group bacterium]|nr:hypothetical protein [Patescibacteria group bacterium]